MSEINGFCTSGTYVRKCGLEHVAFFVDDDGELRFEPLSDGGRVTFLGVPAIEAIDTLLHKLSVLRQELAPDALVENVDEDGGGDR